MQSQSESREEDSEELGQDEADNQGKTTEQDHIYLSHYAQNESDKDFKLTVDPSQNKVGSKAKRL